MRNMKGERCWIDDKLCQEGYCNECMVYRRKYNTESWIDTGSDE